MKRQYCRNDRPRSVGAAAQTETAGVSIIFFQDRVHVVKTQVTTPIRFTADIGTHHLRRQTAAVVSDGDFQSPGGFIGEYIHPHHAVFRVLQTVKNGVFHNGLEDHLGHHARLQVRGKRHLEPAPSGQADGLDFHIALQDLDLPAQRHKLVGGDAEAKNVRKVGGHHRHLGHLVDFADPLHSVQCIAEEMRVELGLEHPDLRLVELPLIFHQLLLVMLECRHHAVEALGQLPQLIEEIAAIEGVEWLRALYCYPERVDERLLDTMKRLPNVCDYLDLPMQHISQHILTDMNRTDTSAHIRKVCRMFKERGMMLRTTLMVGFPGETDEDFEELMDFVAETKFDRMGAFMFCPEDGTRAAEMPNQVPEEVKQERYDRLMTLQHGISLAQNKARVGTTCRVLVEKKRGSRYVGRSEFEAPETDGNIFFNSEEPCEIGTFVNVKITGAKAYDLMGERV